MREPNIKFSIIGSRFSYQPPENHQDENQQVAKQMEQDKNDYLQEVVELIGENRQQEINKAECDFY